MVMAQSLFMQLKSRDADVAIDVVSSPAPLELTERMPEVRLGLPLAVGHGELGIRRRWALARTLKDRGYERAIVLPSSFKSALAPFFAGIPIRTGYRGEWRLGVINDPRPQRSFPSEQSVRGYLGLGTASGNGGGDTLQRPTLHVDATNQARLVAELGLDLEWPVIALAPGAAYGPAKQWPVEHFRTLAARLSETGNTVWVLGGPDDATLARAVLDGVGGRVHDLTGRTTIAGAVDLLNLASVTVSNDSGLMHVAAAAGSRVVALYGPTSPSFAPPLTDEADIFYTGIDCSPCFERTCPLGHHRCLRDITADEVLSKILVSVNGN